MGKLPAVGTLTLIEQEDGNLGTEMQFSIPEGTDPEIGDRVRNTLYGLVYQIMHSPRMVLTTGEIFRNGVQLGSGMEVLPRKTKNEDDGQEYE